VIQGVELGWAGGELGAAAAPQGGAAHSLMVYTTMTRAGCAVGQGRGLGAGAGKGKGRGTRQEGQGRVVGAPEPGGTKGRETRPGAGQSPQDGALMASRP
jgi:hypothetical protein